MARYRRLLLASDLLALTLAGLLGVVVGQQSGRLEDTWSLVLAVSITVPLWVLFAYGAGLYHDFERRVERNLLGDFLILTVVSTAWIWLVVVIRAGFSPDPVDLLSSSVIWVVALVLVPLDRTVARRVAARLGWITQKTAILGDKTATDGVLERIGRHPEWHLNPAVVVEMAVIPEREGLGDLVHPDGSIIAGSVTSPGGEGEPAFPVEGVEQLVDLFESRGVARVIVAGGFGGYRDLAQRTRFLHELLVRGFTVDLVSGGPETVFSRSLVHDYEGIPILTLKSAQRRRLSLAFKRLTDVVLATAGLVVLTPVLAWAAFRIRHDSDGPALFRQVRWGLDREEFEMVKLRTMVEGADGMRESLRAKTRDQGNDDVLFKLEDDPRVTPVGRSLRKWSIDEVPQLWNVVKGEMSMVGPRPLVPEEAIEAERVFPGRSSVKPGVAGPWQALGRSEIPFDDMIRLDLSYVLGSSTVEDFRLLFRTAGAVLRRRGAM